MPDAVEYDFDSVGDSLPTIREITRSDVEVKVNYNPRTPLEFGMGTGGLFVMNTDFRSCVRDNFKNLLLTNWGERVEQYDFGCNLKELTAELGKPAFDSEAIIRIRTAVKKYMPYIQLSTFSVERLPELTTSGLAAVRIKIGYSIPAGGINRDGIAITLLASA